MVRVAQVPNLWYSVMWYELHSYSVLWYELQRTICLFDKIRPPAHHSQLARAYMFVESLKTPPYPVTMHAAPLASFHEVTCSNVVAGQALHSERER